VIPAVLPDATTSRPVSLSEVAQLANANHRKERGLADPGEESPQSHEDTKESREVQENRSIPGELVSLFLFYSIF
jgi:hypothetical protein